MILYHAKYAIMMLGDGVLVLPVLLVSLIIGVAFVWNPCRFGQKWCPLNYSVEWGTQGYNKIKDGVPFSIMGERLPLEFGAVESFGGEGECNFLYETVSEKL